MTDVEKKKAIHDAVEEKISKAILDNHGNATLTVEIKNGGVMDKKIEVRA